MYPSRTTGLSYLWTVVSVSQCMLILCKTEISSILSKCNYGLVLVMIQLQICSLSGIKSHFNEMMMISALCQINTLNATLHLIPSMREGSKYKSYSLWIDPTGLEPMIDALQASTLTITLPIRFFRSVTFFILCNISGEIMFQRLVYSFVSYVIQMQISVRMTRFWTNPHRMRSKSKDRDINSTFDYYTAMIIS